MLVKIINLRGIYFFFGGIDGLDVNKISSSEFSDIYTRREIETERERETDRDRERELFKCNSRCFIRQYEIP